MKLAEIVPFLRLPKKTGTFTYQIPSELEGFVAIGQFVEIPFRHQKIHGVIVEIHSRASKSKKLSSIIKALEDTPSWNPAYIKTLLDCSRLYYASPATFFLGFTPDIPKRTASSSAKDSVSVTLPEMVVKQSVIDAISTITQNIKIDRVIKFQHQAERLLFYRQICSAIKKQVLIITPRNQDAKEIFTFLLKYYQDDVILWDNSANKNKQWGVWKQIRGNKARIIVSTRSGTFLPCTQLGAILIDQEEQQDHKSWDASPYYDARVCLKKLAKNLSVPLFQLSLHPQIRTAAANEITALPSSLAEINAVFYEKSSPMFSDLILEHLKQALEQKQIPVVVSTHKAGSTTLRCLDCHWQWRCDQCNFNLSLKNENLLCRNCDKKFPLPQSCPDCNGQRVKSFGHGLNEIAKDLQEMFTSTQILKLSSENIAQLNTVKQPLIIVSTGYLLKHLLTLPEMAVGPVVLFRPESLLFLPDYRANERLYRFINWHRSVGYDYFKAKTYIQTALKEDDPLLQVVQNDAYNEFVKQELSSRKQFLFPPYSIIYNIKLKNRSADFSSNVNKISNALDSQALKGTQMMGPRNLYKHGKIDKVSWIIKSSMKKPLPLDKILKTLYSDVTIDINPL